jgi:hypothetical protein
MTAAGPLSTEWYGYGADNKRVWKKRHITGSTYEEHIYFYGPGGRRMGTLVLTDSGGNLSVVYKDFPLYFGGRVLNNYYTWEARDRLVGSAFHEEAGLSQEEYWKIVTWLSPPAGALRRRARRRVQGRASFWMAHNAFRPCARLESKHAKPAAACPHRLGDGLPCGSLFESIYAALPTIHPSSGSVCLRRCPCRCPCRLLSPRVAEDHIGWVGTICP